MFPLASRDSYPFEPARLRNFVARWLPGRLVSTQTVKCYAPTIDCADVAVRFFGVEAHKIDLAPLGVDTELLSPIATPQQRADRDLLRARLGVQPDEVLFIYTGQFSAAKNPVLLAQAVETMRARGLRVKAVFLGDGEQREEISAHAGSTALPFVPHRDLASYYRAADAAVWPTQESTSMLDAAACGLPVVVNDTLRATERIDGNGLTYVLNDLAALERVLSQLLDPARRAALGAIGARRMVEHFSWDSLVRRRIKDYRQALGGSSLETRQ